MGRHIANGVADPSIIRLIGIGAVDQLHVMKGHLTWLQHHIHRVVLIDVNFDFLAAGQHVLLGKRVFMRHHLHLVGTRHKAHAATLDGGGAKRNPGGHDIGWIQSPIGKVLMPADKIRGLRLLGEEIGRPAKNIRPKHASTASSTFG